MDLNKLRTFVEVAECESITNAANKLFRTQSAITQQISALENELGLALFERKNARIFLTKEGVSVYDSVSPYLKTIQGNIEEILGNKNSISGTIHIGSRADYAVHVLPSIISSFRLNYPNIDFRIHHGNSYDIEKMVEDGKVDIGFPLMVLNENDFLIKELPKYKLLLIGSTKYLERNPKINSIENILSHDSIDYLPDSKMFCLWAETCAKKHVRKFKDKLPTYVCDDAATTKALVSQNLGIAILPEYILENELANGEFSHVLPEYAQDLLFGYHCIVKKKRSPIKIYDAFHSHVLSYLNA